MRVNAGPPRPMNDIRDRLVASVRRRFDDDALTDAAYHCILDADVDAARPGDAAARILTQLSLFETLDAADEHPEHRIARRIVPRLRDPRPAALYLLRELHLVCDLDAFGAWTREFVHAPCPLPQAVRDSVRAVDAEVLNRIIAPLARFWGDWESYRVARCVALLATNPARFDDIVAFAQTHTGPAGRCARNVERISSLLGRAIGDRATWEWHHVETISSTLKALGGDDHLKHLALCGYVTVQCESALACYETLYRLHARAGHMKQELRDFIGSGGPRLYRAIHTMLEVEVDAGRSSDSRRAAIKVRLIPATEGDARHAGMSLPRMQRIFDATQAQTGTIAVFTRGMEEIRLDAGATVLDFTYAVSRRLIGRVQSAMVNGSQVDEDHPLEAGDTIELVKVAQGEFRNLPDDWSRVRSGPSAHRIRSAWEDNLRGVLRDRGRAWVQQRLMSLCGIGLTKASAPAVLEAALAQLSRARRASGASNHYQRNLRHELGWWLAELGKHASDHQGIFWDGQSTDLTEEDLRRLESDMRQTVTWIQTRQTIPDFPPATHRTPTFRGLRHCACLTTSGALTLGISADAQGAVLHALDSDCASEPFDVSTADEIEFVITAHNRTGIASDICKVFNVAQAAIGAVAAKSRKGALSVIRVRLSARFGDEDALVALLSAVPGVVRVFAPSNAPPAELRRVVPMIAPEGSHGPVPPFTCGPPVEQPEHFYGRGSALATLHGWLETTRSATQRGMLASVRGPHRSGKSSIVLRWLHHIRVGRQAVAAGYVEAQPKEHWSTLHARLMRRTQASAHALLDTAGQPPSFEGAGVGALLTQMRATPTLEDSVIVFVIDEAPALMQHTHQDPAQSAAFADFVAEVRNTPGAMLVIVGPDLPFDALPDAYQALFHDVNLVVVGPFPEAVTLDLVSARQSTRVFPARVEREVALRVHDWTDGDACFSTAIVQQMYQMAFDRAFGAPVLGLRAVQRAVDLVVSRRGEMFVNRLRAAARHCWSGGLDSVLASQIIECCVVRWEYDRGSKTPNERLRRWRPTVRLKTLLDLAPEDEVRAVSRVLARAGVVSRLNLSDGWSVAMTPVLAEYISEHPDETFRLFTRPRIRNATA